MKGLTNWAALWRELVEKSIARRQARGRREVDPSLAKARGFDVIAGERMAERDPAMELVASRLGHDMTVLDIGAGTGRWSLYLARRVRTVTALDPSQAMLDALRENLAAQGVNNVNVVAGAWPETEVEPHDVTLCSHAMYFYPDFPRFVQRMVEVTRCSCYLVMRLPPPDGVMGEIARRLWGHPHDSANFIVGYNILLDMGIYPNVQIEWPWKKHWTSATLDEALTNVKDRFGLIDADEHDTFLRQVLEDRLVYQDGQYVWPDGMRSALVYWNVATGNAGRRWI
ncbi:MAG: class I SAM-dependent methyltransferase [Chloroflexi bacterium]|nr:class I SAM-dependent methyltransferase [Chloroflexota bacterium]